MRYATPRDLLREIEARGDQPALLLMEEGRPHPISGQELAETIKRLTAGLAKAGLRPGEVVALYGPNGLAWIALWFATVLSGGAVAALDDQSSEEQAKAQLEDAEPRLVFTEARHLETVRRLARGGRADVLLLSEEAAEEAGGARSWRDLLEESGEAALRELDADAPLLLLHTSGTTGPPKSFHLSWRHVAANLDAIVAEGLAGKDDCLLLPLPLHHVYPLVIGLLAPLAAGARLLLPEGLTGTLLLQALQRGEASGIIGVPRLYQALLQALEGQIAARGRLLNGAYRQLLALALFARRRLGMDLGRPLFRPLRRQLGPRLRLLVSGGARLDPEVLWPLVGLGFEVRSGYGLAETASTHTANLPGRERLDTQGKPFQGGEVKIAELEEADEGEILLRGPNVFEGYRDNPEANREAFTEDGWFRTGDLGHLDADGFLQVTGRKKELIVLGGGKNVYPEGLEKVYGESPYVEEIAVLERKGSLVALVRPDIAAIRGDRHTRVEEAVRVRLREIGRRLPSHERLAGIELVREALPRTRLGKLRRFLLADLYEKARKGEARQRRSLSAEDRQRLESPRARELWELLEGRYGERLASFEDDLAVDLGIDSLEWITLQLEIERRLGVTVTEERQAEIATVGELIEAVESGEEQKIDREAEAGAVDEWVQPRSKPLVALSGAFHWLNRVLMRAAFRLSGEHADRVPKEGGFLLVANHVSYLDAPAIAAALSPSDVRRLRWSGGVPWLFGTPPMRLFSRALGVFPVEERKPASALARAAAVLSKGRGLVWFPESWRSPDGKLQDFLPGVGRLVMESRVPAVPLFIEGAFEALPRDRSLPRFTKITVRFGEPLDLEELRARGDGRAESEEARIAAALYEAVAALAPPSALPDKEEEEEPRTEGSGKESARADEDAAG